MNKLKNVKWRGSGHFAVNFEQNNFYFEHAIPWWVSLIKDLSSSE